MARGLACSCTRPAICARDRCAGEAEAQACDQTRGGQAGARRQASPAGLAPSWHFVGQLQSRKAASVARYADMVHSVDRTRLAAELGRRASEAEAQAYDQTRGGQASLACGRCRGRRAAEAAWPIWNVGRLHGLTGRQESLLRASQANGVRDQSAESAA